MAWLLPCLLATALATDEVPPAERALVEALEGELARAHAELALPGAPAPYHARLTLTLLAQRSVEATLGGVVRADMSPVARLGVEVRVGSPALDNSGFGGWRTGFRQAALPDQPTPHAVRVRAWRELDRAYKEAVEQQSRKVAQVVLPPDHPGDYTLTGSIQAAPVPPSPALMPDAGLRAATLSAVLAAVPGVLDGRVHLAQEVGVAWVIDTEGTRVRRPVAETTVRAVVTVQAADGAQLVDQRLWTVRSPDDLPSEAALAEALDALARGAVAAAAAPALEAEYVGPVVFLGDAAVDLQRWLLLPQLEGTPPDLPFDTIFGELGGSDDGARVGRRVLPPGWRVVDDARGVPGHPGMAMHDDEGSFTRAVEVVTEGIVRTLLTSRTPHRAVPDGTNGHAWARWDGRAAGRACFTTVEAPRAVPEARLLRLGLRAAAAYGLDHVLVVERLQEPAVRDARGFGDDAPALPPPVVAARWYADGRRVPVRSLRFAAVDRRALRDIVAAGPVARADVLLPRDGRAANLGPVEGHPCRVEAPTVVVAELELVPTPGDPSAVPTLPVATAAPEASEP